MSGHSAPWEPYFLLGAETRLALEREIGREVAGWLKDWGSLNPPQAGCHVLPELQGEPALRGTSLYEASLNGDAVLAIVAPQAIATLLLPAAVLADLPVFSGWKSTSVAAAVDRELARDLCNRFLGRPNPDEALTCSQKSDQDDGEAGAYSRWVTLEVRLSNQKKLFVRLSPRLVFDRFVPRIELRASGLDKRSVGVSGNAVHIQVEFPPLELTLADIAGLEAGDVVLLPRDADTNVRLCAGDSVFAQGSLGRTDAHVAVKVASFTSHP